MPPIATRVVTPHARAILQLVLETPWAIMPAHLSRIVAAAIDGVSVRSQEGAPNGATRVGNVSVIPVRGVIEHRADWLDELFGGVASIDNTRTIFRAELADPAVKAIVLDVDSPGGTASGVTEFASEIRAARGGAKPIVAVANTLTASAAYWLASQADEIVASPSAQVGSVGVYAVHQEASRLLDEMGITTTIIRSGPNKLDANEFEPLTEQARAQIQERVDATYGQFVADVAKGRRTTIAQVEADYGGGRVFTAKQAQAIGMVDRVETIDATINRVFQSAGGPRRMRAASLLPELEAAAIPRHDTPTENGAWDGPANEARLPSGDGAEDALRAAHAWVDAAGDPNAKGSYKFIHHEVSADGTVGAANMTGCSSGIGYLNRAPGATGRPNIPDADRAGVHRHLAGHMMDGGMTPPDMMGQAPFTERLATTAAEAAALVEHARERARLRAKEGRPAFSTTTERSLRAIREAVDELLAPDEPAPAASGSGDPTVPAAPSPEAAPRPPVPTLPAISAEEFRARLKEF